MSKATKELLQATILTRLPCLEKQLEEKKQEGNIQFDDMLFSREYLNEMVLLMKDVTEGRKADFQAIYEKINLEMIANSKFWREVRLYARRLC